MNSMIAQTTPEQLVGIGFRGWMAGYLNGDISCWEQVWNTYSSELGPSAAKSAITELGSWVRQVRQLSLREIEVYPLGCSRFCHDERIAISLIAAIQHDHCPALQVCASALLGNSDVEPMLDQAADFALKLKEIDQMLSLSLVCDVADVSIPSGSRWRMN